MTPILVTLLFLCPPVSALASANPCLRHPASPRLCSHPSKARLAPAGLLPQRIDPQTDCSFNDPPRALNRHLETIYRHLIMICSLVTTVWCLCIRIFFSGCTNLRHASAQGFQRVIAQNASNVKKNLTQLPTALKDNISEDRATVLYILQGPPSRYFAQGNGASWAAKVWTDLAKFSSIPTAPALLVTHRHTRPIRVGGFGPEGSPFLTSSPRPDCVTTITR